VQIFDRKYRLFGVINIIDLLVVVALVVGGLVVYKVLLGGSTAAVAPASLKDIEYVIVCTPVRNYAEGQIRIGDPVSTKTSGATIGTVVSVRATPTLGDTFNPTTGRVQRYESTVAQDILVTVKAKGTPTATGVSVGNMQLRNNELIQMVTPTFQCDTAVATGLKIGGE